MSCHRPGDQPANLLGLSLVGVAVLRGGHRRRVAGDVALAGGHLLGDRRAPGRGGVQVLGVLEWLPKRLTGSRGLVTGSLLAGGEAIAGAGENRGCDARAGG